MTETANCNEKARPALPSVAGQDDGRAIAKKSVKAIPRISINQNGDSFQIQIGKSDSVGENFELMQALGTTDLAFYNGLLNSILNAAKEGGKVADQGANFIASVVAGIEPRDQLEAMLAVQMAAIHNATIATARHFTHAKTLQQLEVQERALNKLARTFTTQIEALKRYRSSGQQKVTVEHVTVNAGGQAIVGTVEHPGGGGSKSGGTTP
ncbi:MAG: hypothetical protein P4L82_02055 [Ancalomicrobiaceae bacterium]|nr:hypothetical protein [Ancalomicrobiaceae bacterium]